MREAFRCVKCWALPVLVTVLLAACGGGGGSSATSTSVSGVASKGPIKDGTVSVYAVNADGSRGRLLGTARTSSSDGSYATADLAYRGSIIVIVSGGTYVDEATGITCANPGLKAALPDASGSVKVAVTPLTDVAFKQMSSAAGGFTTANISAANAVVSTVFGVNITATQPVDPTDPAKVAAASQASIEYGVALAAISGMVKNGDAVDVKAAIEQIKGDLSAPAPQLLTTGPALSHAINDLVGGTAPVLAPSVSTSTISVDDAIAFFTTTEATPPVNGTGVALAKGLVSDLRNTVLSVVDYKTGDVSDTLKTPFNAVVQEVETVLQPELAPAVRRLGWVASSAARITGLAPGTTYTFTDPVNYPGQTLTVVGGSSGTSATVTISSSTTTLLSGTVSVSDLGTPTSGSINISTLKTANGNATVSVSYNAAVSNDMMTSFTLTGNITTPVASFDFADGGKGQKLTADFAEIPGSPGSVMPTRIYFKGSAATRTVRITGGIDIAPMVWNPYISPESESAAIPKNAVITAKIEALSGGSTTLTLNGTLTGAFINAATYDPGAANGPGNFPAWSGTFDGAIAAAGGLNLSVLLKGSSPAYKMVNFEAKYTRVLSDGGTVFLSCAGTADDETGITTATMTNQNGVQVALSYNRNVDRDSRLNGTMKTSGGETVGNFSTVSGVPRVSYADNYFETIF